MAETESTLNPDHRNHAPSAWREFKAASAAINVELPQDHPLWRRYYGARDAILTARPTDLAGLAVLAAYYQHIVEDSDPNEDDRAMLAHVVDKLTALASAPPAGPLSSTF